MKHCVECEKGRVPVLNPGTGEMVHVIPGEGLDDHCTAFPEADDFMFEAAAHKQKYIIEFEYGDDTGDYLQIALLTEQEVERLQKFFEALEDKGIIEPKDGMGEGKFIFPWSAEIVLTFDQLLENYTDGYLADAGREEGIEL